MKRDESLSVEETLLVNISVHDNLTLNGELLDADESLALNDALEKQIPNKIKSSNIEGFSTLYGCPRCDKMCRNLWSFGIKTNYCPDCGQKLDWGDK